MQFISATLPGPMITKLMRRNRMTISALASANGLTQKRVRKVRADGVSGFLGNEWHWLITGKWLEDLQPDQLSALLAEARSLRPAPARLTARPLTKLA